MPLSMGRVGSSAIIILLLFDMVAEPLEASFFIYLGRMY
jgi:hypothetical protein